MAKKEKLQKQTKTKVGDVHITNNQRLKNYYKPKTKSNKRMVVVSDLSGNKVTVNAIVSDNKKNKKKLNNKGYVELPKKRNKFLKNNSLISKEEHTKVYQTRSEKKKTGKTKKNIDLKDREVFTDKIGRISWKDKKKLKKSSK